MAEFSRKTLLNVPNMLTYGRILVTPLVMLCLMVQGPAHTFDWNRTFSFIAAVFFILAGISDIVDGYYARKYGQVSLVGKLFDPMADKVIHMAVMVMLIPMGRIPAWFVVLHLFRELAISGLRSVAAAEGLVISAGVSGKRKTAWLNVGLSGLLIYYDFWGISSYSIGWVSMVMATIYSLYSAYEYGQLFYDEMSKRPS